MNQDQIAQLATEIAKQTATGHIYFYVILSLLTLATSAIGAYGASYFKTRGEANARQADFKKFLTQLEQSEGVKALIQFENAQKSELRALYRTQLGQLAEAVFDTIETFNSSIFLTTKDIHSAEIFQEMGRKLSRLQAIQKLYFSKVSTDMALCMMNADKVSRKILALNEMLKKPDVDTASPEVRELLEALGQENRIFQNSIYNVLNVAISMYASSAGIEDQSST